MARVIQRRPGPPYLLIVFVFLFLVSTTLAVLFYTKLEDERKLREQEQQKSQKLAGPVDLEKGYVKERMASQAKPVATPGAGGLQVLDSTQESEWAKQRTVITRLEKHLSKLSDMVNPKLSGSDEAISKSLLAAQELTRAEEKAKQWKAEEVLTPGTEKPQTAKSTEWAGVEKELEIAYESKFKKQKEVCRVLMDGLAGLQDQLASQKTSIEQLEKSLADASSDRDAKAGQLADLQNQVSDLETRLQSATDISEERNAGLEEALKKNTELGTRITALARDKDKLQQEIIRLKTKDKIDKVLMALNIRSDGSISDVVQEQKLCYISIGAKDGVRVDHTFAVYPKSGIGTDPKTKGHIQVIKVDETVSSCRIVRQDPRDQIEPGDLIANLSFDATRKYKFLVAGEFDLYNTGRTSPRDKREVVMRIESAGGEVVSELDIQVDYAVMGIPPTMPERAESLAIDDPARYKALKDEIDRYNRIRREGPKLGVYILNTNRFLDLMGWTPRKGLTR